MEQSNTDKRIWTRASEDGKHAAAGMSLGSGGGMKTGAGGKPQPYGWHGYYGETGGGSSPGPVYRGMVTPPHEVRGEARKAVNPAGGHDPQGNPVYTYMQCSGNVYDPEGNILGKGYSGNGPGYKNPKMENAPFIGPIPAGFYRVGRPMQEYKKLRGHILPLTPIGATALKLRSLDRSGFLWHGGQMTPPFGSSEGCIVSSLALRSQVQEGSLIRVLPCEEEQ